MKILSLVQNEAGKKEVSRLVDHMNLEIITEKPKNELIYLYDENGLALVKDDMVLHGNFMNMKKRLSLANLRGELLVRTAKIKGNSTELTAIDATAGLGEDSLLLAASGFQVDLYEHNPIIAALLRDAIMRASNEPELQNIISRMHLIESDSKNSMTNLDKRPNVILLDPMFPKRQKSGLIKKKFQLMQSLEQPCVDENDLMQAAIKAHPQKIIVKRPLKGPFLAGVTPNYSISGKGIRYDCITLN